MAADQAKMPLKQAVGLERLALESLLRKEWKTAAIWCSLVQRVCDCTAEEDSVV